MLGVVLTAGGRDRLDVEPTLVGGQTSRDGHIFGRLLTWFGGYDYYWSDEQAEHMAAMGTVRFRLRIDS